MPRDFTFLPRLASLVFNQPHYITPHAAEAIVRALDSRITTAPVDFASTHPEPRQNRFAGDSGFDFDPETRKYNERGYQLTPEGAAIIDLTGELVNRGAWLGAHSGLISYEGLQETLKRAAVDTRVTSVILDLDSPGGQASGMAEASRLVKALDEIKPVIAVVNDTAASAGFGLASGARRIITSEFGTVGSIGVVLLHADYSKKLEKDGVKVTMMHAGAHKVDGNPFEPLSDDVRNEFEGEVERFYDDFVSLVATNRPALSDTEIRATEARVYLGKYAVSQGLADDVGTFDEVLSDLKSLTAAKMLPVTTRSKETSMSLINQGPAEVTQAAANDQALSTMTLEQFRALRPDFAQALVDEGRHAGEKEGREAGARAERERILGIEAMSMPGHDALIADMKADGNTSPEMAAIRLLKAEKASGESRMQALADEEKNKKGLAASTEPDGGIDKPIPTAQTPEGWRTEWEASEKLQGEFISAAHYVAFKKAETAGNVKIFKKAG